MTTEAKTNKDITTVIFDKISGLKGKDAHMFYSSLGLLLIATIINIFPLFAVILSISIGIFGIFSVMKDDLKTINNSITKTIKEKKELVVPPKKIIEKTTTAKA